MSDIAKKVMEGMAGLFSAGERQGSPPKSKKPAGVPAPTGLELMVDKANPTKRGQAADSLSKAFKK